MLERAQRWRSMSPADRRTPDAGCCWERMDPPARRADVTGAVRQDPRHAARTAPHDVRPVPRPAAAGCGGRKALLQQWKAMTLAQREAWMERTNRRTTGPGGSTARPRTRRRLRPMRKFPARYQLAMIQTLGLDGQSPPIVNSFPAWRTRFHMTKVFRGQDIQNDGERRICHRNRLQRASFLIFAKTDWNGPPTMSGVVINDEIA